MYVKNTFMHFTYILLGMFTVKPCYLCMKNFMNYIPIFLQYAISQLRFVRSGLHLVTFLDVGNFSDKSTETTLHEICVQVFLRFSDSGKPSQSVSLIYKFAWLAGFRKSEENLLKTSCKAVPVIKVANIFWWRHDDVTTIKHNQQVRVNIDRR